MNMFNKAYFCRFSVVLFLWITTVCQLHAIEINGPKNNALVNFGLEKLNRYINGTNVATNIQTLNIEFDHSLEAQSFILKSSHGEVNLRGADPQALMYGLFELAEQVQFGHDVSQLNISQSPFIKKRGLKLNVPLDARNPSYDDTGDSAQHNITTMWELSFWHRYLDRMAEHRYNQLTLWNPQPFTSMLKLEKFPGLALDDVFVSNAKLNKRVGVWGEAGGVTNRVLSDMHKVKSLTIDEKISFWREVMRYAKSRGIDVHFITWAIYTNGINGDKAKQYGIDERIDNLNTIAFFREAAKEMVLTYPDLKGIGITAGERMAVDGTVENWSREKWLWQTYGLGLQDAKKIAPSREVDFMHRFWYSGYKDIEKYWGEYPDHFSFSFKYLMARTYSSTQPSHIAEKVLPMLQENPNVKTWWNLRNDDIFVYRWGNPEYTQAFLNNLPMNVTEGIHMGSDGYVWGKTFADQLVDEDNYYEIDKHWYKFMIWGRLAYNNDLSPEFFSNKLKVKFPSVNSQELYLAWQAASEIVPAINRYQFQPGDRKFAPETSSSRETFRYVNDFQVARSMPKSGQMNARAYVNAVQHKKDLSKFTSPLQLADFMSEQAELALAKTRALLTQRDTNTPFTDELSRTLDDISAFSYLGLYYAEKIRAATALEFYEKLEQSEQYKKQASESINKAVEHWADYRKVSEKNYRPQMLARVNKLDWQALEKEVLYEKEIVAKKLAAPFTLPETKDPEQRLTISYQPKLGGEHRHQRLQVKTPDAGEFMIEVYEHDGVFINNYHNQGNGTMRWEWFQERPKGRTYYLNLKWRDLNRIVKVST